MSEMEYLVRFVQMHESFRQPELRALARLHNLNMTIDDYRNAVSGTDTSD